MKAMTYETRNLTAISKLADNTKVMATKWYEYCKDNDIDILITETIRTVETQRGYVAKGVSQTMKSYHIVGQALDFVPVVAGGKIDYSLYKKAPYNKAVSYAKSIGFEWGGDWTSFKDLPHLQNNYKGYGTDTFGKAVHTASVSHSSVLKIGDKGEAVKAVQAKLKALGYDISVDGIFGKGTEDDVKDFQSKNGLGVDGIVGINTNVKIDTNFNTHVKVNTTIKPKPTPIKEVGKIKIINVSNACYICDKPSTNSKNVGTAKKGSILPISGSVTGWYEVIYNGERAYVNAKYGQKI